MSESERCPKKKKKGGRCDLGTSSGRYVTRAEPLKPTSKSLGSCRVEWADRRAKTSQLQTTKLLTSGAVRDSDHCFSNITCRNRRDGRAKFHSRATRTGRGDRLLDRSHGGARASHALHLDPRAPLVGIARRPWRRRDDAAAATWTDAASPRRPASSGGSASRPRIHARSSRRRYIRADARRA